MKKKLSLISVGILLIAGGAYYLNDGGATVGNGAIAGQSALARMMGNRKNVEVPPGASLFIAIPGDWFTNRWYGNIKHSAPIKTGVSGTLSTTSNLRRSGDIYFMPDGGTERDEIRIVCERPMGVVSCYDEPGSAQYDEQGRPIGVGIWHELRMLVEDTREGTGADPRVFFEGFVIEHDDERLGKISYAAKSELKIYLIDAVVSEKNKKSREMRLASKG